MLPLSQWSFLQLGRPGAPRGGLPGGLQSYTYSSYAVNPAAYEGTAIVKNLIFHRGKAAPNTGMVDGMSSADLAAGISFTPNTPGYQYTSGKYTAPVKSWWGMYVYDYMGLAAGYKPAKCGTQPDVTTVKWEKTTTTTTKYTNTTEAGSAIVPTSAVTTSNTETIPTSSTGKKPCPMKQYKMGCGGVSAIYGANSSVTTFHNCDFKYGLALMGGGICFMGRGQLLIKGDPVFDVPNDPSSKRKPAGDMQQDVDWKGRYIPEGQSPAELKSKNYLQNGRYHGLTYQSVDQDELTGSLCNFERNQAFGGERGAGGAIYSGWRPVVDGNDGISRISISGCNFFRNVALNTFKEFFTNGGTLSGTGGPGHSWDISDSSFYENNAERGGLFFDAGTKGLLGNAVPGRADIGTYYQWGMAMTLTDVYVKRHGHFDPAAMFGCSGSWAETSIGAMAGGYTDYGCLDVWNEDFKAVGGLLLGTSTGGMAAVFNTWSDISRIAAEIAADPSDYSWTPLINAVGNLMLQDPGLMYRGNWMITDPMEGYACKGYDQFGTGPSQQSLTDAWLMGDGFSLGGVLGQTYSPYNYPNPFFENCGTPGMFTINFNYFTYGGTWWMVSRVCLGHAIASSCECVSMRSCQ